MLTIRPVLSGSFAAAAAQQRYVPVRLVASDRVPGGEVVEVVRPGEPRVVHQHVEARQVREERPNPGCIGHVEWREPHAGDIEARTSASRRRDDLKAVLRQAGGYRSADPARAPRDHGEPRHAAVVPPSTGSTTPVMNEAASDARNAMAAAISAGEANRPSGTAARYASVELDENLSG